MEEIDFDDLQPVEVPVRIAGKRYVLREASGDAAIKRRNALMRANKSRWDEERKRVVFAGLGDIADVETVLVAACLYEATPEGKLPLLQNGMADPSKLVGEALIRSWPVRVQTALYERVVKISKGLLEAEQLPADSEGREKNGHASPTTTAGSG